METPSCCQCLGRGDRRGLGSCSPSSGTFGGSGAEGGQVTPADPCPISFQEQQVLKEQHPRLQGWRGEPGLGGTTPPKPWAGRSCWLSDLPQLVLSLTSTWGSLGIQARTGGSA